MPQHAQNPSPSSFIGQVRLQLKQELEERFCSFLYRGRPPAPAKSNVWIEESNRDLHLLLRSNKARKTYEPLWPKVLFQLERLSFAERVESLNRCLDEDILPYNPNCKVTPLGANRLSANSIDLHASKLLLPALKTSFQTSRSIAPELHQQHWLYLNFAISIGRHLATHKLGESHTLCTILCMKLAGVISCFRFLHASLGRRPDQADAIEWLAYDCLEQNAAELSHKFAKDWQLQPTVIDALIPNKTSHKDPLLEKTLEECLIASYSCLLFNQGLLEQKEAQHILTQWQLPLQLLIQFKPKN
ncbi:hypothetical protein [Pseudoteredinibacter isoporae]|uniref:Uncharacterized protein n=1 Tax=Pseudoteredinibacter isoporae TaxID=570281 RepID=A0A7X0MX73_9GAMM|nr:hypothetical protein [Pseudoteredinibacter isoporae]MBB6522975.1 hypothetical protein [Pseudoteredinibacter isoporae]NHO88499.1 hypothetical protein [Pseudoteredinibacter isoporae]NIB22102.1 hypothetical protein [Pseudoteredinibacter isoporae]